MERIYTCKCVDILLQKGKVDITEEALELLAKTAREMNKRLKENI